MLHADLHAARAYCATLAHRRPQAQPAAPAFRSFAEAGHALAELHLGYGSAPEYPLGPAHTPGLPLTYRVEKVKLDAEARTLRLNDALALTGIPAEAHRYTLGNRSALDWLLDGYRAKEDKRSGIVHDPNAAFDGDALGHLLRRVTHVSLETVRLVEALPGLRLP